MYQRDDFNKIHGDQRQNLSTFRSKYIKNVSKVAFGPRFSPFKLKSGLVVEKMPSYKMLFYEDLREIL